MNRKIYIGIAVAIVLIALWMWWSKKKAGKKEAETVAPSVQPEPLDVTPEETDVMWSAEEIEPEEQPSLKEE
jgi:hypothetical protein